MIRSTASFSFCVCIALLLLPGCVSSTSGNASLNSKNISQLQKGVTTRAQVEAMLGSADNVMMLPGGGRQMFYQGQQTNGDKSGSIFHMLVPFSPFVPASDKSTTHRQILQITLNSQNIVQDFEFSDTTSQRTTTSWVGGVNTAQTTTATPVSDSSASAQN